MNTVEGITLVLGDVVVMWINMEYEVSMVSGRRVLSDV